MAVALPPSSSPANGNGTVDPNPDPNLFDGNETTFIFDSSELDQLFQSAGARVLIVLLYTAVFIPCFFGNIIVMIGIVSKIKRNESVSSLLLGNLAIADLCVAIFCIYPNMVAFIYIPWKLGKVVCKLYYYAQSVCYSVSLLTLVAMAVERYVATLRPLASRRILRKSLLTIWVCAIWVLSLSLNVPHLFIYDTFVIQLPNDTTTEHCIIKARNFPIGAYVTANFVIWFCIPVLLLGFFYFRICIKLTDSKTNAALESTNGGQSASIMLDDVNAVGAMLIRSSAVGLTAAAPAATGRFLAGNRSLRRRRRRIVRLLVAIVLSFILTMLPYQIRTMWQTWSTEFVDFNSGKIFTISTFLLYYSNSALHPILYALLSSNFRQFIQKAICQCHRQPSPSSL